MLIQLRDDPTVRLFRQHDHALAAGELAAAWVGPGREPAPLAFEVVLATALHDLSWQRLDESPAWDPVGRRPCAFHDLPLELKLEAYVSGLDETERIHPYGALLSSLHYTSFPDVAEEEAFQARERSRRDRIVAELGYEGDDPALLADLAFLRLFDNLSLFLCLTPPPASVAEQPGWVDGLRHLQVPGGPLIHLTWLEDDVLHVDPFPFHEALELRIKYRELTGPWEGPADLEAAWRAAPALDWWVSVRPAPRLA